jgi:hypothetical protein
MTWHKLISEFTVSLGFLEFLAALAGKNLFGKKTGLEV